MGASSGNFPRQAARSETSIATNSPLQTNSPEHRTANADGPHHHPGIRTQIHPTSSTRTTPPETSAASCPHFDSRNAPSVRSSEKKTQASSPRPLSPIPPGTPTKPKGPLASSKVEQHTRSARGSGIPVRCLRHGALPSPKALRQAQSPKGHASQPPTPARFRCLSRVVAVSLPKESTAPAFPHPTIHQDCRSRTVVPSSRRSPAATPHPAEPVQPRALPAPEPLHTLPRPTPTQRGPEAVDDGRTWG